MQTKAIEELIRAAKENEEMGGVNSPELEQAIAAVEVQQNTDDDYQGAMADLEELIRVARDNPAGLRDFLMCNYPKHMGLSKRQHKEYLEQAPTQPPAPSDVERVARAIFSEDPIRDKFDDWRELYELMARAALAAMTSGDVEQLDSAYQDMADQRDHFVNLANELCDELTAMRSELTKVSNEIRNILKGE